jgi:aminoglycoside phosphotransferase (APT) family kinase protein
MKLDSLEKVKQYLILEGLVHPEDKVQVVHLPGGVSCRVWKITRNNDQWVLKQALEKLDVEADWFSDVERIHREHQVMHQIALIIPNSQIPKILHVDFTNHVYMMSFVRDASDTWKSQLMQGVIHVETANSAASLLRQIHELSHKIDEKHQNDFKHQDYFIQLRIEAFHRFLIQKYPEIQADINHLIDELTLEKTCLVHGDFSPKNMLVKANGEIVLLDFEVAHWGNPVFDVAYCIGHLMLKAWHLNKTDELFNLIRSFLDIYGSGVKNLIPHLGLMLLARMDGKSPVNYILDPKLKNKIRLIGVDWIRNGAEVEDFIEEIALKLQLIRQDN